MQLDALHVGSHGVPLLWHTSWLPSTVLLQLIGNLRRRDSRLDEEEDGFAQSARSGMAPLCT